MAIPSLNAKLQTFSPCSLKTAKKSLHNSTMAPLGVPTRMIFLHCQFSVGKPVRGGKELLLTKPGLADLL